MLLVMLQAVQPATTTDVFLTRKDIKFYSRTKWRKNNSFLVPYEILLAIVIDKKFN